MKANRFWITAIATVTTSGMIGVAIAQTATTQTPSGQSQQLTPGGMNTGSGTSGTGSSSPDKPISADSNMNSSSSGASSSSDASSNDSLAQADRG